MQSDDLVDMMKMHLDMDTEDMGQSFQFLSDPILESVHSDTGIDGLLIHNSKGTNPVLESLHSDTDIDEPISAPKQMTQEEHHGKSIDGVEEAKEAPSDQKIVEDKSLVVTTEKSKPMSEILETSNPIKEEEAEAEESTFEVNNKRVSESSRCGIKSRAAKREALRSRIRAKMKDLKTSIDVLEKNIEGQKHGNLSQ